MAHLRQEELQADWFTGHAIAAQQAICLGLEGCKMLCGGAGDPTVPPALHQVPMKADFDSRKLSNVTTVDVDAYVQATYGPGGKAPTDPTSAAFATYYGSYHGTYEPPFCHAQAKGLFDLASAN